MKKLLVSLFIGLALALGLYGFVREGSSSSTIDASEARCLDMRASTVQNSRFTRSTKPIEL